MNTLPAQMFNNAYNVYNLEAKGFLIATARHKASQTPFFTKSFPSAASQEDFHGTS